MTTLSTAARNAACDATVDLIDVGTEANGVLSIRDEDNHELVAIALQHPAFGSAVVGVATLEGAPLSGIASDSGEMSIYAVIDENYDILWTGTIGTTGTDMIVDDTTIVEGQSLIINAWTHTVPA